MSSGSKCRECGTAIPADNPGGFCARCLLGLGLEKPEDQPESASNPVEQDPDAPKSPAESLRGAASGFPSLTEKSGDRIGRYRLLQEIGHGGCGVVYMAEQEEPVRRKVALKVIKLGMDTRQVVARFEAERQALAMMDHPNIAKILDAGITEAPLPASGHPLPSPAATARQRGESDEGRGQGEGSSAATRHSSLVTSAGRPYFVMELVGGIKITDYCDQHHLTTRQRLDLFSQVCRAIQHAHQKGIIHRDIKPSNVLVTTQDGTAVPKVIDFGIAKATQGRLTDHTIFTAFEQFIGTPAYMSPEQAQIGGLDIDTRSDIYSLGVLLYELLTGKTPFETKELVAAGLDEMRRVIREVEPVKPSTRLTQGRVAKRLPDSTKSEIRPAATARQRGENPKSKIDRDLDWIVMKCLEKDRGRRYDTANGLARDIERHLNNEPVVASPPSRIYRLKKAVRRNKTVFAAAAIVAVLLVTGVVATTSQAIRATQAKTQALNEKGRADEEAAKQETINSFLNDMLASADPDALSVQDQVKGRNITMLQVLDEAARRVEAGSLKDRPAIEAAIRQTLGRTYLSLGKAGIAEPLLRRALELNRQIYGAESENAIASVKCLSEARGAQGKVQEAEQLAREVISLERKLHGKEHPHIASALILLADSLDDQARGKWGPTIFAESEASFREALAMQRKLLPADSPELIHTLISLARLLNSFTQNVEEAEILLREALQIQTALRGHNHPTTAQILRTLADVLLYNNNFDEAERLFDEAVALQRELLGTNHMTLSDSLIGLGMLLQRQKRLPESEAAFREALAIRRQAIPGGLDVAWTLKTLAENLTAQNRFEDAELLYRESVQIRERIAGVGSAIYWEVFDALANVLRSENKPDELEALYREALDKQRNELGTPDVAVPAMMCLLSDLLVSRGKPAEAAELHRQAIEAVPKLRSMRNRTLMRSLTASLRSRGELAQAEGVFEVLIHAESQNLENPNFNLTALHHDYGLFLGGVGKLEAAGEQFLRSLSIRRHRQNQDLFWTLKELGAVLAISWRAKQAEPYLRESLSFYRTMHWGEDLRGTAQTALMLATVCYQQGKLPEAEQSYREAWLAYTKCNAVASADFTDLVRSLAEVLIVEQKLPEAESVLNEALAQERQILGERNIRTAAVLIALARCLDLGSRPDQAAHRRIEAADILTNSPPEDLIHLPPELIPELIEAGLEQVAREVCNRASALTAVNASWLEGASWALVLSDRPSSRNAALAVELAQKAVETRPESRSYQNPLGAEPRITALQWRDLRQFQRVIFLPESRSYQDSLGAALYRAGEWPRAVIELEQAAARSQETQLRCDLFFLAMAHQRVGEAELARRYYSEAVSWMADHCPAHKKLLHLRAETEALLGVNTSSQRSQ